MELTRKEAMKVCIAEYTGLLGLIGACVIFSTGCISHDFGNAVATNAISQAIVPPLELSLSAAKFRQANRRWPRDYDELSAFLKSSSDGVQLRPYDRVDFTENSDGSLEIYAIAPGLTNRMTLTAKDSHPK